MAIDFNHCSVPGTDTYKDLLKAGQPPLIFGYGRVEAVPNDGIYLEDIVWTPLGAQHARNFEDLSPAIRDEDGEVTLVHSVALTPNGKVRDLNFFTADPAVHEHRLQNAENKNTKMVSLTLLAAALGLPETAEEKTILEKLSRGLVTSSSTEMVTLSARIEALENALRKNSDEQQGAERQRIVTLLSTEGKAPLKADRTTYSREELLALDVPTLKLLDANTPVTVPLSARGMTSQMDGQGRFVSKDSQGNLRVDLAGIFNSENERNGQSAPKFA